MFVHTEERRAWVRLRTHTVVLEGDPDFDEFSVDPTGDVKRLLRFWLAEPTGGFPRLKAYLGSISISSDGPLLSEVFRLLRRASEASGLLGERPPAIRRMLLDALRRSASAG